MGEHSDSAFEIAKAHGVHDKPRLSVNLGGRYYAVVVPGERQITLIEGTPLGSSGRRLTSTQATQLRDALTWALEGGEGR